MMIIKDNKLYNPDLIPDDVNEGLEHGIKKAEAKYKVRFQFVAKQLFKTEVVDMTIAGPIITYGYMAMSLYKCVQEGHERHNQHYTMKLPFREQDLKREIKPEDIYTLEEDVDPMDPQPIIREDIKNAKFGD